MAAKKPTERIVEEAGRISRNRAIQILCLLIRGRSVMIQTHDEPETLRAVYQSEWIKNNLASDPQLLDPIGRIRWLRDVEKMLEDLGVADLEIELG